MAKGFILNEADRDALEAMLEEFRGRRLNTTGRPRPGEDLIIQAPEVYAAKAPEAGIPALTFSVGPGETGTGSDSVNTAVITPGSAECEVYRLLDSAGTDGSVFLESADFTRTVYNLSTERAPGNAWALIARDKFGSWWLAGAPFGPDLPEPGTGTGTGTGAVTIPGAGPCFLAALRHSDCVKATGPYGSANLKWDGSAWSGASLHYPGGSGAARFWFADGRLHFSVSALELLDCGDGCFSGGPLTGHESATSAVPCDGDTFTVCVKCDCCEIAGWGGPGWYCIRSGTGTDGPGTGTSSWDCVPVELLDADRCDDSITICSGPYASEAAANLACGTTGTIPTGCCPGVLLPETLHATLTGGCTGSALLTWNGTGWQGSAVMEAGTLTMLFFCELVGITYSWKTTFSGCYVNTDPMTGTCTPFSQAHTFTGHVCCFDGMADVTVTITE